MSATHLHKILERELWISGAGDNMMSSERGLTQVLRTHLKLEGLPDNEVLPVKRWNGKTRTRRPTPCGPRTEHDRARHLVVELKAPDFTLDRKELDQVGDYTNVIVGHPRFVTGGSSRHPQFWRRGGRSGNVADTTNTRVGVA